MDKKHKYIDTNTFEIKDNIIEVDAQIAETISVLSKKGYKVKACSAGHVNKEIQSVFCSKSEKNTDFLRKYNIDVKTIIEKQDRLHIYFKPASTDIYIMFTKNYHFNKSLKGFKKYLTGNKERRNYSKTGFNTVKKVVPYFRGPIRKSDSEIEKEIAQSNKELLEWAKSLPRLK